MSCRNLNWSGNIKYLALNASRVPESGGLYKILRNDGIEDKLTRVYVGKAVDLRSQFNYHLSYSEKKLHACKS